jgi:hypothetical protein
MNKTNAVDTMIQVVSPVSKPSWANAKSGKNRKMGKKGRKIPFRANLDISPYLRIFVCDYIVAIVMPNQKKLFAIYLQLHKNTVDKINDWGEFET